MMRTGDLVGYIKGEEGRSLASLERRFGVSARTIRSHIHTANQALDGCARISFSRQRNAYVLDISNQVRLDAWLRRDSKLAREDAGHTGRVLRVLNYLLLSDGWTRIGDLASMFFVSQQSVSNDLKAVEARLSSFDLALARRPHYGMRVEGTELARRICLAQVTSDMMLRHGDDVDGSLAHRAAVVGRWVDAGQSGDPY